MARVGKWPDVEKKLVEVEVWARKGLTEAQIFKNLGIGHTTGSEYKKRYPEFLAALKRGQEPLVTEIENALVKRALGFRYTEVETFVKKGEKGEKIITKREVEKEALPDVGACAILLKNKAPEKYTNDRAALDLKKQELELRRDLEEAKNW